MGFHSLRNIGFSFTEAEATCRKWREKYTGFDPVASCGHIHAQIEDRYVLTEYLGRTYRLNCENGVLEKCVKDNDTDIWTAQLQMNEALSVYHYLGDGKELIRPAGRWVPEHTLDPVSIRTSNRVAPLFRLFASRFAGKLEEFNERCRDCGGTYDGETGDAAWIFYPVPEIPIKIVFWDADDEFPAQIQTFVKENATDYVHYEAVSFMIADIFQMVGE